jgi:uncharacterized OB-fold protein
MQKAINELVDYVAENDKLTISFETVTMAIAALEKQIPKKANKNIMGVYCPVCKNLLDGEERFCLYCGQHINWSEVEE